MTAPEQEPHFGEGEPDQEPHFGEETAPADAPEAGDEESSEASS
ncbi:hypothetical protein [Pseudonocardia sp. N23]|nr:hypothetical protein [Pseudonocardia sp. N23]GAY09734.1 hypothetical protein TOK_4087 [Pseudonocardia sp. N23]